MSLLFLRWRLRLQRQLGWAGIVAIVFTAAALSLWLGSRQVQQRSQALAQSLLLHPVKAIVKAPPAALEPWQQLAAELPRFASNAGDLKLIVALAKRHHIALDKGDYQLIRDPQLRLTSFGALFPMRDNYVNVKGFVADVLQALPHAALEELAFDRGDASSQQLDARVRLTLIYQGD
jgi:hypothetical protein